MDSFFYLVIFAGAVAGASTGFLGVYIVGMRMPFIGTCISHAAMAGTIFALIFQISPAIGAIAFSLLASTSMAAIPPERSRLDTNVGLAILFSFLLGLTFLGVGLMENSRSEMLGLLWGSLLFVQKDSVAAICAAAVLIVIFAFLFGKEMKVLLFSRSIAAATGIHERLVYCIFLALCGITISVNLQIVGGLMVFSLITNPAAAAYQVCSKHKTVIIAASGFGMLSTVLGFLVSYWFDLPSGACIVLLSTAVFAGAAGWRRIAESGSFLKAG
ncbi:metal ABC transporter permease [Sedimentisphaera salicampi]|uniref:High-affinity zinc uptake system membrane protein ZnuB n=1 Tax=Sedimentisphaera salicampi TaxID=1941349 RepID=A0A1W6LL33_9BACT|nr:metal ABC transporter permease [Sedimentisphaera salicampi]ARN56508.1 High-affinity zinc uptake system membrane protein ZnuB [Sedimentisphaera salicampi]OXU15391.1 High-affinity zinc uptake system membrane protein ZnuB [Sedimentisphaera salicampi]